MRTYFHALILSLVALAPLSAVAQDAEQAAPALKETKLYVTMPEICPTPDGMALDQDGKILVACPNYGDQSHPAVVMSVDKDGKCRLAFKVATHPDTGVACPMGIEVAPDGDIYIADNQPWMGDEKGKDKGQILRLKRKNGKPLRWEVVAWNMGHPNGIKVHDNHIYVTHSMITKDKEDGLLISGVYRFKLDDKNVKVNNKLDDANLIATFKTLDKGCQYGADGLVFDSKGNLFVGNFGDAMMHKITFDEKGEVKSNERWATDDCMKSIDGICIDAKDNIYVADFSNNSICLVTPEGKISVFAHNEDTDGRDGGMDEPGEPIIRDGKMIISSFDMVLGDDKLNKELDDFQHLSVIELDE